MEVAKTSKKPSAVKAVEVEKKESVISETEPVAPVSVKAESVTAKAENPVPVKVASKPRQLDYVKINVLVDIDPAPRIGTFSFAHELNLTKLVKGVIVVPKFVADVLIDGKKAQLIDS